MSTHEEIDEGQDIEEQASLQDDIESAFDEQAGDEIETETAPEPVTPAYEPPQMWSKEYKEIFNEWGQLERGPEYQRAMRELYDKQEKYVSEREQEAARYRQRFEQFNGALEPYNQFLMNNGIAPHEAARRGVGIMSNLASDPKKFALDILERTGYDFASHGQDAPYVPPEVQELRREIDGFKQAQMRQQQEAHQREAAQLNQQIQSFASATDAGGELKHPHYNMVEQQMAQLVYGYRGLGKPIPSIEELYNEACRLHPDVAAQAKAVEAQTETARKAAEAKRAKTASIRATGKHTGKPSSRSLKEDIEAVYDDIAAA